MRDIQKVIEAMLKHVPEDENDLRTEMKRISRDAAYRAPELHQGLWGQLQHVLAACLGQGDLPEWGHKVGRLLADIDKP